VNLDSPSAISSTSEVSRRVGRRKLLAWLVFAAGVVCAPIDFIVSGLVAEGHITGISALVDFGGIPLLFLGPVLCFSAPFLVPATTERRVLLGFAALLAFFVVGVAAFVFCIFHIHGLVG